MNPQEVLADVSDILDVGERALRLARAIFGHDGTCAKLDEWALAEAAAEAAKLEKFGPRESEP